MEADNRLPQIEKDLEWQIDRRARIQKLLFELHEFLEEHREFPQEGDDQWFPMMRMIHTAFSLWRSAFLTNVTRSRKQIYDHTREFLRKILQQNTITFADDHRLNELTIGYYNSNARYRLERMHHYSDELKQTPTVNTIYEMRSDPKLEHKDQRDLWDKYFLALEDCLASFRDHWDMHLRPQRKVTKARKLHDGLTTPVPRSHRVENVIGDKKGRDSA